MVFEARRAASALLCCAARAVMVAAFVSIRPHPTCRPIGPVFIAVARATPLLDAGAEREIATA